MCGGVKKDVVQMKRPLVVAACDITIRVAGMSCVTMVNTHTHTHTHTHRQTQTDFDRLY